MIMGEKVILIENGEAIEDAFGRVTYEEVETEVDNVVVGSPSFDSAVAELNLTGKRIAFILGIPKGDTHDWKDKVVVIRGERFRTYGFPLTQTDANVPGAWNTQVKVERYE